MAQSDINNTASLAPSIKVTLGQTSLSHETKVRAHFVVTRPNDGLSLQNNESTLQFDNIAGFEEHLTELARYFKVSPKNIHVLNG